MIAPPVSVVSVARNGFFFTRLMVEKVREYTLDRRYEIIVSDRGSRDGSRAWLSRQDDVRLLRFAQWRTRGHGHGEAAERAARTARFERIVLLDFDAHPLSADWLAASVDRLDEHYRLAGAVFVDRHKGNPYGWYVHPHFMTFFRSDLDGLVVLRKLRGDDTDTGEEATIRVLDAGLGIIRHPIQFCSQFSLGHERVPTVAGGVFHAWYSARLEHDEAGVIRETGGQITRETYLEPLKALLRAAYQLSY
jgi:GT2 family glycosyltransferase